ncbi:MAG: DUF721 domain-containing protein [Phycisphaerae bacterium]|nr:DUF721 domain-containing protein [Phycisphaerae bacterium]
MAFTPEQTGRRTSHREYILRREGLLAASPAERELFWRRYNEGRRRSARKAVSLGELIGPWLKSESASLASGLSRAIGLWTRLLPVEYRDRCRVESLRRGALRVVVDGKPTAFALRRHVEAMFLKSAQAEMVGVVAIERVEYRVGRVSRSV